MTKKELLEKLANVPDDAKITLVTTRDIKFDALHKVKVYTDEEGNDVYLKGYSTSEKAWKERYGKQ